MELISLYTYLDKVGGAENLCVDLHNELLHKGVFSKGSVCSFSDYEDLGAIYKKQLSKEEYLKFNAFQLVKNSDTVIFLSHHRKTTTYLLGISKLLGKKINIVHIAHSTLLSLKHFSIFPDNIVAVSNSVKQNHESYFKLKGVEVIYNGVHAPSLQKTKPYNPNNIVVTIAASICDRKQQLALSSYLKAKLPPQIQIQFAGVGPDLESLKSLIGDDPQFQVLGYVEDVQSLYQNSDYILLFSKAEGLPLSLIEAQSCGTPIICNDVGGNLEILTPGKTGFFVDSLKDLLSCLADLPNITPEQYKELQVHSLENFEQKFQFETMIDSYTIFLEKRFGQLKQINK